MLGALIRVERQDLVIYSFIRLVSENKLTNIHFVILRSGFHPGVETRLEARILGRIFV